MKTHFERGLLALVLSALLLQLAACSSTLPQPGGERLWVNGSPEARQ